MVSKVSSVRLYLFTDFVTKAFEGEHEVDKI